MFGYLWLSAFFALGDRQRCGCASAGNLMEVLLAVDLLLRLVQKLQHFPDDGLQRAAQVFPAVRLSQRGHVNECGAAMAEVQRCVVGEVTQIPAKDQSTYSESPSTHHQVPQLN